MGDKRHRGTPSPIESAAVRVGPSAPTAAGLDGQYAEDTSSTHLVRAVPEFWKRRWVTVKVEDNDLELLFGTDDNVEAVYGQNSTVDGSGNITNHANTGDHFFAGQAEDFYVEGDWTHFSFEAAGAGRVTIRPSDREH